MYPTRRQDPGREIALTVWDILDERFGDTILFGPIAVAPWQDCDIGGYLRIHTGYDFGPEYEAPISSSELLDLLEPRLAAIGVESYFMHSFEPRKVWNPSGLGARSSPARVTILRTEELVIYRRRHHSCGGAWFLLKPVSESVARVTHRDQAGYIGISREWEDSSRPYTSTRREEEVRDDGVAVDRVCHPKPSEAFGLLCDEMLADQRLEDARSARAERSLEPAAATLRKFLEEMPGGPYRAGNKAREEQP